MKRTSDAVSVNNREKKDDEEEEAAAARPRKYKRRSLTQKGESWIDSFELPDELRVKDHSETFNSLWSLHPQALGQVKMFGKLADTPRWQQSYGQPYKFSGLEHQALPVPPEVQPYLDYVNSLPQYGGGFNMALLNWYQDGRHHIGYHADDESQMKVSPSGETLVFSLSFGQQRTFSLKPKPEHEKQGKPFKMELRSNLAIVMGGNCQKTHKHAILKVDGKKGKQMGRRINMTFRQFV